MKNKPENPWGQIQFVTFVSVTIKHNASTFKHGFWLNGQGIVSGNGAFTGVSQNNPVKFIRHASL